MLRDLQMHWIDLHATGRARLAFNADGMGGTGACTLSFSTGSTLALPCIQ